MSEQCSVFINWNVMNIIMYLTSCWEGDLHLSKPHSGSELVLLFDNKVILLLTGLIG